MAFSLGEDPTESQTFPAQVLTSLGGPPSFDQPGEKTTEFWSLIAHYVLGIFVLIMAFFHPGYHLPANFQGLVDAVVPSAVAIGTAISHYGYARSRATVKVAQANLISDANAQQAYTEQKQADAQVALQVAHIQNPTGASKEILEAQGATAEASASHASHRTAKK